MPIARPTSSWDENEQAVLTQAAALKHVGDLVIVTVDVTDAQSTVLAAIIPVYFSESGRLTWVWRGRNQPSSPWWSLQPRWHACKTRHQRQENHASFCSFR